MKPEYSKTAARAIGRINNPDKQRIRNAINNLPLGDVKKLKGYNNAYRLRVGDYRILFDMDIKIEITNILSRGDAYKK
jgi:mRNA-degrading endonuclease RelE of RelBE toxin-antitoxin system